MLTVTIVPADGRQTVPERGVVTSRDTFKMLGAPSISQESLKIELSNLVQRDAISSLAKMDEKLPLKGVVLLT